MWFRPSSIAALAFVLPLFSSRAQQPPSDADEVRAIPLGTVPGYEEAKKRANEGLSEPSGKRAVKLADTFETAGATFGGSFPGDTFSTATPPDLTIAAGRNHLVAATNQGVRVFDKDGNRLVDFVGLCTFFNQDGVMRCRFADSISAFDPRVIYDEYLDRFWVTASSVNNVSDPALRTSFLFIALSNSGDPTAGWSLFSTDAMLEVNEGGTVNSRRWCDYPTAGIDAQALYIGCNMFQFGPLELFIYSKLRIMTKQQFIDGAPILWWDFFNHDLCEGILCAFPSFGLQPAHMHGAQISDGEFLINSSPLDGFALSVRRVTNADGCCIPGAQRAPTLEKDEHAVGHYGLPRDARQQGTTARIDTGSAQLQFAVWRAGRLSTAHNVACGFLAGSCVAFTELDVSNFSSIQIMSDVILNAGPGSDLYYPAADVNASGNKTMVFSKSGEHEFASAAFLGIDADGTLGVVRTLSAGVATYVVPEPGLLHRNRWGDYSGAAADPDGVGIWIYGEFVSAVDTWAAQIGITQRSLHNPIPHIAALSPSTVFAGTPGLTLTIDGVDFLATSEVRVNGSRRDSTFVSSRRLTASILPADLQTEGLVQITVVNPAPGGGTSEPAGLFACAGSILWVGPPNGSWQTPGNWGTGTLPGSGDDVCIGRGARVILSSGVQSIRSLRSQGGLEISGGTLTIANPSFINNALTITGSGTLSGPGNLALSGMLTWTGGTISGSGPLSASGGMTLNFSTNHGFLFGRTLTNTAGAILDGGPYTLYLGEGAVFANQGTFDMRVDQVIAFYTGAPAAFNNAGAFLKSAGSGIASFNPYVAFNNSGTVAVQSGTLSLNGGGSSGGSYTVDSSGTLGFGGDHTLSGNLSGDGRVRFSSGSSNLSGAYNLAGSTEVTGGTVNFNPGMTVVNLGDALNLTGGTLNLSSGVPALTGSMTLAGTGTLTGSGALTVARPFTWTGGTISGSGPLSASGGMTLNFSTNHGFLLGRTLTNTAGAIWDGGDYVLYIGEGAVFANQGTFDMRVDRDIYYYSGAPPAFNNAGAFLKSAGSGIANVSPYVAFNNSGTVSAQIGTLRFSGGYTQSAGSTSLEGGAMTSTTTMNIQGGSLTGVGTFTGNVSNAGTASPGSSITGRLNVVGGYTSAATANLNVRIGGRATGEFDVLAVMGSAGLDGALNVTLVGGYVPQAGESFDILTYNSVAGTFSSLMYPPGNWDVQYGMNALTLTFRGAGAAISSTTASSR